MESEHNSISPHTSAPNHLPVPPTPDQKNNHNEDIENREHNNIYTELPTSAPADKKTQGPHGPAMSLTAGVIVISLLCGIAGGVFGNYLVSHPLTLHSGVTSAPTTSTNPNAFTPQQQAAAVGSDDVINVVKNASPAVVSITSTSVVQNTTSDFGFGNNPGFPFFNFSDQGNGTQQQVTAGSGFFVSSDGLIVTNKHVVADSNATYTVTTSNGKTYDAKVMSRDPINDLAIVKINIQNAPYLTFANSGQLQIGQHVVVIGNSLGQYQNTVTSGIVSGIGRNITAGDGDTSEQLSGVIQTDAAINPGNSGGPLLNLASQVVGIATAMDQQGQLVGFALPSNDIARDLQSFQKNGQIVRPFLGVRYVMVDSDVQKQENLPVDYGALIIKGQNQGEDAVVAGSPAAKAGLQENDTILEVNGQKVQGDNTLSQLLKDAQPNQTITLKIMRNGQTKDVQVTLAQAQ